MLIVTIRFGFLVGQRYGLTMQEFGHLLHHMRVCNFKTSDDMIGKNSKLIYNTLVHAAKLFFGFRITAYLILLLEDIFYKTGSVPSGSTAGGKWPLMTRAHLAQALLCAALLEKAEDCSVSSIECHLRPFLCHLHPYKASVTLLTLLVQTVLVCLYDLIRTPRH